MSNVLLKIKYVGMALCCLNSHGVGKTDVNMLVYTVQNAWNSQQLPFISSRAGAAKVDLSQYKIGKVVPAQEKSMSQKDRAAAQGTSMMPELKTVDTPRGPGRGNVFGAASVVNNMPITRAQTVEHESGLLDTPQVQASNNAYLDGMNLENASRTYTASPVVIIPASSHTASKDVEYKSIRPGSTLTAKDVMEQGKAKHENTSSVQVSGVNALNAPSVKAATAGNSLQALGGVRGRYTFGSVDQRDVPEVRIAVASDTDLYKILEMSDQELIALSAQQAQVRDKKNTSSVQVSGVNALNATSVKATADVNKAATARDNMSMYTDISKAATVQVSGVNALNAPADLTKTATAIVNKSDKSSGFTSFTLPVAKTMLPAPQKDEILRTREGSNGVAFKQTLTQPVTNPKLVIHMHNLYQSKK